jgi:DNA-damage-inducible protein D
MTAPALLAPFDAVRHEDAEGDYWSARDLMPLLGYERWENFAASVERARAAAINSGHGPDHVRDAAKMVPVGSGAYREVADYRLTRFGAYLVTMNGDPRKGEIAAAQSYFAVRTREAEVMAAHVPAPLPDLRTPAGVLAMAEQFAATARQLVAAEEKVAELEPKADLADTFLTADGSTRLVREVAKLLSMRERDLWRFLLEERLLFAKHAACGAVMYDFYASYAHHFVAKETPVQHTFGTCSHYTIRVTARGVELIRKRLRAAGRLVAL